MQISDTLFFPSTYEKYGRWWQSRAKDRRAFRYMTTIMETGWSHAQLLNAYLQGDSSLIIIICSLLNLLQHLLRAQLCSWTSLACAPGEEQSCTKPMHYAWATRSCWEEQSIFNIQFRNFLSRNVAEFPTRSKDANLSYFTNAAHFGTTNRDNHVFFISSKTVGQFERLKQCVQITEGHSVVPKTLAAAHKEQVWSVVSASIYLRIPFPTVRDGSALSPADLERT